MVLLSCRASPFRRLIFRRTATLGFSVSMLVSCVLVSQELFAYFILHRANIITFLDTSMPIINRKAIGVAAMGFVAIWVQMWSINTVRGQEVVRLRVGLKTASEKLLFMCVAVAAQLFSSVLCTVYAKDLRSALASGLLHKIVEYDENAESRYIIDRLQTLYDCCGIGGAEDYEDLSAVDLYGIANPLPKDKTLKLCSAEETTCLYPLSCCHSVECTEYRLAELNIEGDVFHERWYKKRGCVSALLSSNQGLLDPMLPIWLLSVAFGFEIVALMFAQVPQLIAKAEPLPESHEGKILAKEVPKLSECQITLEFGRSHLTTNNFVKDSTVYGILTLTSYLTLAESGLSDADESIAWLLPFTYPGPEDIVQYLTDWAEEIYAEKEGDDEGGEAVASKAKSGRKRASSGDLKPGQVPSGAAIAAALGQLQTR